MSLSESPARAALATPGRRARIWLGMALGGLISAFFLWLALRPLREIEPGQVRAAFLAARWWWPALAVATYFLDLVVRAWRWSVLLRPVKAIESRSLLPAIAIGYMGNMLLPARLGEVLRAAVLGRRYGLTSAGLGAIATERVLDGLTTVALLLTSSRIILGSAAPGWLAAGLTTLTAFFLAALAALGAVLIFRPLVHRLLTRITGRFSWALRPAGWVEQFLDGVAVLRAPGLLARAVGISLVAWALSALEYYWIFRAFGLGLGPVAPFFAVSAVGLSTVIPSAPGYVGTFEFAGVTVLTALGVAPSTAFSATVLLHLVELVPVTFVGLILLWREGIALSELSGRRSLT